MEKYTNIRVLLTNKECIFGKTNASEEEIKTIVAGYNNNKLIALKGEDDHIFCIPAEKIVYVEFY